MTKDDIGLVRRLIEATPLGNGIWPLGLFRCLSAPRHYLSSRGTVGENVKYMFFGRGQNSHSCLLSMKAAGAMLSAISRVKSIGEVWGEVPIQVIASLLPGLSSAAWHIF